MPDFRETYELPEGLYRRSVPAFGAKVLRELLDELVAAGEVIHQGERRWRRYWRGSKGQAVAESGAGR